MKTVIITGATGSIGQALIDHLKKDHHIISWDMRRSKNPLIMPGDALILCHGGWGESLLDTFTKNALSVGDVLLRVDELVKPDGIVILLTSRSALSPTFEERDYSAAKAAARSYALGLYKARPDLRITTIAPGWVESKMAEKAGIKNVIPVKELVRLIEICIESHGMRIPEIAMEPIGDARLG